jgi:hypothetical protein
MMPIRDRETSSIMSDRSFAPAVALLTISAVDRAASIPLVLAWGLPEEDDMNGMVWRYFESTVVLVAAIAVGASDARAQAPNAEPFLQIDHAAIENLLRPRSIDEITREMDSARLRLATAEKEAAEARAALSVARGRIDVKEQEISLLKNQLKLAKKEKNPSLRASVEGSLKSERDRLALFEHVSEAFEAAAERADAAVGFHRSRIEATEAEHQIADIDNRRIAMRGLTTADPLELEALDRKSREAVRVYLKRLAKSGAASSKLAKATEHLAETKLELLDAWDRAGSPK